MTFSEGALLTTGAKANHEKFQNRLRMFESWSAGGGHIVTCLRQTENEASTGCLKLGWASADITPDRPVVITGGSAARVSEGVRDHIYATALAMESTRNNGTSDMVIMVSLDLVGVTDILYSRVQDLVRKATPEVDANKIILNATHTHTAPDQGTAPDLVKMHSQYGINVPVAWAKWGIDLGVMSAEEYVEFAAQRIAEAIGQAWKARKPGGISFGLSYATTGRNRLTAYYNGTSEMYGAVNTPRFQSCGGLRGPFTGLALYLGCERKSHGGSHQHCHAISSCLWKSYFRRLLA